MNKIKLLVKPALVMLVIVNCVLLGSTIGDFWPMPEGRHIFTPWMEIISAVLLLVTGIALASFSRFGLLDLGLGAILTQVVILVIINIFTDPFDFDSFYWGWVGEISRFITPPFIVGVVIGHIVRILLRKHHTEERPEEVPSEGCTRRALWVGLDDHMIRGLIYLVAGLLVSISSYVLEVHEVHLFFWLSHVAGAILALIGFWYVMGDRNVKRSNP